VTWSPAVPRAPLRHMAFWEALSRCEDSSYEARTSTAGLLMLRLVDHWMLAGAALAQPESVSINAMRRALADLPTADAQRLCLLRIVNTIQTLGDVDLVPLYPHFIEYGRLLERTASYAMAADVYAVVTANATEADAGELLVRAHLRTGFCRRVLGELEMSTRAYNTG
jgi:hypothetical protein